MDNPELVALYEIKRQAFLLGFVQFPEKFNSALAFAYYHRLAPYFHGDGVREAHGSDPFEEVYAVKRSFMNDVLKYVDKQALAGDLDSIQFSKLEDKFGGYKTHRMEIVFTLEYARINRRFDDKIWAAIQSNAPVEANQLDAKFLPDDVYFD